MKLTYRIHEWVADHVEWVQYPQPHFGQRLRQFTHKQIYWLIFAGAWVFLILLSIWGNSLP